MGRISEIDQKLKDTKQWFKDHIPYIVMIFVVFIIAIAIYGQADRDIKAAQEKENRINNIERTLQEHMHYIEQLEDDVHELKEQEVLNR